MGHLTNVKIAKIFKAAESSQNVAMTGIMGRVPTQVGIRAGTLPPPSKSKEAGSRGVVSRLTGTTQLRVGLIPTA